MTAIVPETARWLPLFLLALVLLAVLSVVVGSRAIDPAVVWQAIVAPDLADDRHVTVQALRLPRTALVVVVGAALGVAGAVMQAMTRNPLAEPGLLGVNAGAAAAVVTGVLVTRVVDVEVYLWFAFAGAALAAAAVYALGGALQHASNPVRLVLAGAALSVVLGAYTSAVLVNFPSVFDTFRFWDTGSFQGRGGDALVPVGIAVGVGLLIAFSLARPLNALALGAEFGRALGASPRRTWLLAGVAVVLLAGGATAAAGPIGFIGLTAPLIGRAIVGPDYSRLLPFSALVAAIVLLAADILGRVVVLPSELQASIVTAVIGGPVFIALVRRRRVPTL
ncbi:FecCD family ABC transporter permease [Microbacterium marinilacus]|uniref:FecCD family ABC transporter permease n=1 Tax=Microbacterium marinilacus TaxID=415209 RepID=UPI0027E03712|nr:iron chelate uptake ABC transporter family permease subunit [Microbacterium marinilacus]